MTDSDKINILAEDLVTTSNSLKEALRKIEDLEKIVSIILRKK